MGNASSLLHCTRRLVALSVALLYGHVRLDLIADSRSSTQMTRCELGNVPPLRCSNCQSAGVRSSDMLFASSWMRDRVRRREFISFLGGAAATWPFAARAQQPGRDAADRRADGSCRKRPGRTGLRRGVPGGTPEARVGRGPQHPDRHALGSGRRDDDATIRPGTRRAAARPILTQNTPTTEAMLQQTRTIPIIFANVADPVGSGFVANFPRPGGNATGFTLYEPTMAGKWLELLKEIAPRVARVAFLFNPATAPYAEYYMTPFKAAAASFGVEAIAAPVRDPSAELESVVAALAREPNGGLIVMPDIFLTAYRVEITSLVARYRVPAVYPFRLFAEVGGLLSYGNDLR